MNPFIKRKYMRKFKGLGYFIFHKRRFWKSWKNFSQEQNNPLMVSKICN